MTNEQEQKLIELGEKVRDVVPRQFHGSVRFNLHPDKKCVNMNIEQSFISEPKK